MNHIASTEVTIVDVKPFEIAETLAAGKVDAIEIWEPITHEVIKNLNSNAIAWPGQADQDFYWLLVGREEVIQKKPTAIEKLLLALRQAADFMKQQPREAQVIMSKWLQVPISRLQSGKFTKRYELFLDQGLILAMEDEARWLIRNRRPNRTKVPDYLDFIAAEALSKVDPKAVSMVLPARSDEE